MVTKIYSKNFGLISLELDSTNSSVTIIDTSLKFFNFNEFTDAINASFLTY